MSGPTVAMFDVLEVGPTVAASDIALALGAPDACVLCGEPAEAVGLFIPDDPARWPGSAVTPGKRRVFRYGICGGCVQRDDREAAIEAALRRGVALQSGGQA